MFDNTFHAPFAWIDADGDGLVNFYAVPGGLCRQAPDGRVSETGLLAHDATRSLRKVRGTPTPGRALVGTRRHGTGRPPHLLRHRDTDRVSTRSSRRPAGRRHAPPCPPRRLARNPPGTSC